MNLEELSKESLLALRSQVGDVARERIDALLSESSPPKRRGRQLLPKKSEEDIRKEIIAWAWARGAVFVGDYEQGYRPDACPKCGAHLSHSTRVPRGTPDVLVFWMAPMGQWWIEAKSRTGVQSQFQREFEAYVKSSGGVYVLARSVEECEARYQTETARIRECGRG